MLDPRVLKKTYAHCNPDWGGGHFLGHFLTPLGNISLDRNGSGCLTNNWASQSTSFARTTEPQYISTNNVTLMSIGDLERANAYI